MLILSVIKYTLQVLSFMQLFFKLLRQCWNNLKQVAYDTIIGNRKYRRIGICIDGHNNPGCLHAGQVLDLAGDTAGNIQVRSHRTTRLAYLMGIRNPSRIHSRTR